MATKTQTVDAKAKFTSLSKDEILRYSRHLIMPEVGMDGQLKLKNAKVLLIGTGGLGAPLGLYLAAAGVGKLGLVDFDVVDSTNLQRQVTFGSQDVGTPKTLAAKNRLSSLNSDIEIATFETKLESKYEDEGEDLTIIACGPMVPEAMRAAWILKREFGCETRVLNMHTLKPIDEMAIIWAAKQTGVILTAEEHQIGALAWRKRNS